MAPLNARLLDTARQTDSHAVVQEMNSELKRQEKVLDAVTDHTDRSAYELQNVSQQAKKDFKVRPGEPSSAVQAPGNVCMPEHHPAKLYARRQRRNVGASPQISGCAMAQPVFLQCKIQNGHCRRGRLSAFFNMQLDRAVASSVKPCVRPQSLSELGRLSTSEYTGSLRRGPSYLGSNEGLLVKASV